MLHCFFLARDLARVFCTTCSARLKSVLAAHKSSMGYELYWTGCVDLPLVPNSKSNPFLLLDLCFKEPLEMFQYVYLSEQQR